MVYYFKGKGVQGKFKDKWVYGYNIDTFFDKAFIRPVDCPRDFDCYVEVDRKTVEQCSFLESRNGYIFSGDILDDNDGKPYCVCMFVDGCFGFVPIYSYVKNDLEYAETVMGGFATSVCTILGNIHDNTELLIEK